MYVYLCEIGTAAGSLWQQDTLNQQAQILGLLGPIPSLLLCCLLKVWNSASHLLQPAMNLTAHLLEHNQLPHNAAVAEAFGW